MLIKVACKRITNIHTITKPAWVEAERRIEMGAVSTDRGESCWGVWSSSGIQLAPFYQSTFPEACHIPLQSRCYQSISAQNTLPSVDVYAHTHAHTRKHIYSVTYEDIGAPAVETGSKAVDSDPDSSDQTCQTLKNISDKQADVSYWLTQVCMNAQIQPRPPTHIHAYKLTHNHVRTHTSTRVHTKTTRDNFSPACFYSEGFLVICYDFKNHPFSKEFK